MVETDTIDMKKERYDELTKMTKEMCPNMSDWLIHIAVSSQVADEYGDKLCEAEISELEMNRFEDEFYYGVEIKQ